MSDIKASDVLKALDHTLLKPEAGEADYRSFFAAVKGIPVASVCIPPNRVAQGRAFFQGETKICTVVGFPNGYSTPTVKAFEARKAVEDGADEVDMVLCLGNVIAHDAQSVTDEVWAVREAVPDAVLKVIIESGALTEAQIRWLCDILPSCGPNFLKTSTGFNFPGASLAAVRLMREALPGQIGIKASGGIRTLDEAMAYLAAGATRIGASSLLKACLN